MVVPARGGSKGVPRKNLRAVGGVPLVSRVGALVRELDWVDRAVCSTDHGGITVAANEAGLETPFYRAPELSGDRVGDLEVLTEALLRTEEDDGERYDVVVMLQPTSPLRRPEHVTRTVDALLEGDLDAAWTVSPTDSKAHPLKQLRVDGDGALSLWDERGAAIVARQQLEPVYHRNGAAYAIGRACLLEQKSILGARTAAVVIDEPMLSIDTEADFQAVERALAERAVEERALAGREAGAEASAAGGAHAPGRALTFVVDVDGVLACMTKGNDYTKSQPLRDNVARINALHDAGHRIVLFTARGSATGRDWLEHTRSQMLAWGVKHHDLRVGKPSADYYIDDRLVTPHEALAIAGIAGDPAAGSSDPGDPPGDTSEPAGTGSTPSHKEDSA